MDSSHKNYIIFCDGAYSSNRKQGGCGIIVLENDNIILEFSNTYKNTTNNQMELFAIILSLSFIKNKINSLTIYSDSMYCLGTILYNWKIKCNLKLWQKFYVEYDRVSKLCNNINFIHIKGHQKGSDRNVVLHNHVDKLAFNASRVL